MLGGQNITLFNSITIGLTGILVVMVELGLLSLVVIVLSKITTKLNFMFEVYELGKKNLNKDIEREVPKKSEEVRKDEILEEEVAIIAAVICEESKLKPEEFIITSIIKK